MVDQFMPEELAPFATLWHMPFVPLDVKGRLLNVRCKVRSIMHFLTIY